MMGAYPDINEKEECMGDCDKARLEQVLAAWSSLDIPKTAEFYAKDANLVFYDATPLKYSNWAEYEKGLREGVKYLKSVTFRLRDDTQLHHQGNLTWATATVDSEIVLKDGSCRKMDLRWTSIWEKRSKNWLIVHDHFSVPVVVPPPMPAAEKP
jgi:ketosteroid isomerase-like protein